MNDEVERVSNDRLTFLMQHGAGKSSDVPPLCLDLRDCRARLEAAEAQVAALREVAKAWREHHRRCSAGDASVCTCWSHADKLWAAVDALEAAAQARDQRVRREERERVTEALRDYLRCVPCPPYCSQAGAGHVPHCPSAIADEPGFAGRALGEEIPDGYRVEDPVEDA